jgi:hypothetical protein
MRARAVDGSDSRPGIVVRTVTQYVVIGTSPFNDVSVAVGPLRSQNRATDVDAELTRRGWNTEVCPLMSIEDVGHGTDNE